MKLHEVEPLHAQALQRAVDHRIDVAGGQFMQRRLVRHQLGVHLDSVRIWQAASKTPDQALHPGVDICAVKSSNTLLDQFSKDAESLRFACRATSVVRRQLPAAIDHRSD
jgi:hypothetical protein